MLTIGGSRWRYIGAHFTAFITFLLQVFNSLKNWGKSIN